MKIYTRRGDRGQTDLFGGERVDKDALRVEVYGEVDELNASLGVCAAASSHADVRSLVEEIQSTLFTLGSYLATPDAKHRTKAGIPEPTDADVDSLEKRIDAFEAELPALEAFILPGGVPAAAAFQLARTVCRRAERRAVELHRHEPLSELLLHYLNRLSDLLFVLGRVENRRADRAEPKWQLLRR